MKVLIIQENGRHARNRHFRECFALQSAFQRLGWEADIWGLGHPGFPGTPDFNAYDVVFNLENYDTSGWVPSLTQVKAYKIMWVIDAHVRGMAPYREIHLRDRYDLMLQATRDFITGEADARIKKNSVWFPNCFNDALIHPQDMEKEHDVGFCGNIVNREPYLSFIEASFQLKRDIFVIGADMVRAINSYKVHFNKNISNDINYRSFETLGCRTLLLTNANPQYIDLGFVDGENCLIYHDLAELREKIQYALDQPRQREEIAENGYQLGKRHTYDERVKSLVSLLRH
jgi:Glycosyl transferases group 1